MASGNRVRELRHELSVGKFRRASDGSLTVKDVPLLATGTWTDSNFGTPLFYPEDVLERYAENWIDNSLWSRHGGFAPRSITDKIGEVTNLHYNGGAVRGDLVLHGKSSTSRDTIEMLENGLVNYVSVEHGGSERWNEDTQSYIAEDLAFYGVAVVNRGACETCTINNESRSSAEANDMELKELETKLAEAESKIKELSKASAAKDARLSELESKVASGDWHEEEDDDESDKLAELEAKLEKLTELEARLEKIEKTPFPPDTLAGEKNELGAFTLDPIMRDTEGITRRMF